MQPTTQGFETLQHELDAKRTQLEHELATASGRVAEIQADLERVHEALAALTGTKKKSRSRARTKKPASSVAELQRHIAQVREDNPFADAKELQKGVRAMVRANGQSLSGFATLFAEALVSSPGPSTGGHHTPHSAHGSHTSHTSHQGHVHSAGHGHADGDQYSS